MVENWVVRVRFAVEKEYVYDGDNGKGSDKWMGRVRYGLLDVALHAATDIFTLMHLFRRSCITAINGSITTVVFPCSIVAGMSITACTALACCGLLDRASSSF